MLRSAWMASAPGPRRRAAWFFRTSCRGALLALWLCLPAPASLAAGLPVVSDDGGLAYYVGRYETGLGPEELGVIVNDADPLSVRIGRYYQEKRGIPDANVIHVRFAPGGTVMTRAVFEKVRAMAAAGTPARVQAYALAWTSPYRVECMAITAAFAFGFHRDFCASGCAPTAQSPYFDSASRAPARDHRMRPAMMLAGLDFAAVKSLIDRGVASDYTQPAGTGYLLDTGDRARNVRAATFANVTRRLDDRVRFVHLKADYIENRQDVLFYFTGAARVPQLHTNTFLPGAVADHLTSGGGRLTDSVQMSSLRWLEAGATASYGTALEPCNFPQKFPRVDILTKRYLQGETVIEAYWKSVAMPGQGVFIGEPLAKPYGRVPAARTARHAAP